MKVIYVGIETAELAYGEEYEVIKEIKVSGHCMGYDITCNLSGTTFVRPYEVEIRPEIEVGKIYQNRNGKLYLCKNIAGENATMERTTDHWTLVAHGIRLYEDGTIEWNYSTGGHWKRRI